jgi:hypothetical protein
MKRNSSIQIQPQQSDPAVWIERFVIFETVEPLSLIREIPFRRGVNIVWAVEQEEANDAIGPTEVAGHSAGKTTLCRLLRYCLGEERFGTDDGQKLIRLNLSGSYVGAHIWVEEKRWAVARPIGAGNRHYAAVDLTVEELLESRTHANDFGNFVAAIEDAFLKPLKIRHNPRTGLLIHWKQILAWCARDQESHYEDVWSWRSPRSASESIGFEKPKIDAVFVMRVLLGLVAGDEADALKALKEKEKQRDKASEDVAEARKEPEYWDRYLTGLLSSGLNVTPSAPLDNDNLFQNSSLSSELANFTRTIESQVKDADIKLEKLDRDIRDAGTERRELLRELNECLALLGQHESSAKELEEGRREAQQAETENLTDHWVCPYSQELVTNVQCWNIYENRRSGRSMAFSTAATDLRDAEQLAKRRQDIADLRTETKTLTGRAEQLRLKLVADRGNRDKLREERDGKLRQVDTLARALGDLRGWRAILKGEKLHPRLADLGGTLAEREKDVRSAQERVLQLLKSHKAGRQQLTELFDDVVKAVLSNKYGGAVALSEEDLRFDIMRGPPLGGEAINILSVLLADVTALIASINGIGFLPRLLIHDSPRESDLARHIYWNFLGLVFNLEAKSKAGNAPFQYIVTTTTPPPPTMREKPPVQEKLNAADPKGSLFGRVLTVSTELPFMNEDRT